MEIRKGKDSVLKKYGFRSGGGLNHLRYDHQIRPVLIEVTCPNCKHRAIAKDMMSDTGAVFCFDISPSWDGKPFNVICSACKYSQNDLSYAELPEEFHQIHVRFQKLWAWNIDHLNMIYFHLKGVDIQSHPYFRLSTYIHGEWKKNPSVFLKAIEQHVAVNVGGWQCIPTVSTWLK